MGLELSDSYTGLQRLLSGIGLNGRFLGCYKSFDKDFHLGFARRKVWACWDMESGAETFYGFAI